MAKNIFVRQFACRNFGFYCTKEEKELFHVSQWTSNRIVFLIYRILMWAYAFGFTIAYFIYTGINFPEDLQKGYRTLTAWGDVICTIYFSLALALTVVGMCMRHELHSKEHGAFKVLRSVTWMFQTLLQTTAFTLTVLFWALLTSTVPANRLLGVLNIHRHGITSILALIEVFVVAFPVRLLHVVYAMLLGVFYCIVTLIVHGAGVTSAVYRFVDWANNPGLAVGVAALVSFVCTTLIQCMMFGCYCLRLWISRSLCHNSPNKGTGTPNKVQPTISKTALQGENGTIQEVSSTASSVELEADNPAFERE